MASIVLYRRSNKRRNRVNSEKLFDFEDFGIPDSMNPLLSGAFRDNIRVFLHNFAEFEEYTVNEMPMWCTTLFDENEGVFPLYTVEETVQDSLVPFCNHCKSSGWGHHFVCKRKYHFIIPAKENWDEALDEDFAENQRHILYGLIHCNGYGHLLCINGLKNDSKFFDADDTMEFWDRLCTLLKARCISACNVSKKKATLLNLIHGAAYGNSWFDKWGYKYNGGSPGITEQKYNSAIRFLNTLSLDKAINNIRSKKSMMRANQMVEMYKHFSENPLITVSDLLKFILISESKTAIDVFDRHTFNSERRESVMGFETFVDLMRQDCRWSAKRLENVLFVVLDLLKEHKETTFGSRCGMSRQELRDRARQSIGDTGLIDFVLKSIRCFAFDDQIMIRRAINPFSRLAEFNIHEITSPRIGIDLNLSEDVRFLYQNSLLWYSESRTVLNSHHFVKDWPITEETTINRSLTLICKVLPSFDELETTLTRPLSPGEVVVVEPGITVGDLRMVAQSALRDTYCVMDEFEVTQVGGLRKIEDEKVVHCTLEQGVQVWVRGIGFHFATRLRYEDGRKKSINSLRSFCLGL